MNESPSSDEESQTVSMKLAVAYRDEGTQITPRTVLPSIRKVNLPNIKQMDKLLSSHTPKKLNKTSEAEDQSLRDQQREDLKQFLLKQIEERRSITF